MLHNAGRTKEFDRQRAHHEDGLSTHIVYMLQLETGSGNSKVGLSVNLQGKHFENLIMHLFSGMNPMTSSRNCALQQSLVNCRGQCIRMRVSLQKI